MDARVDGVPVTPRRGKAVEINALWVNGLAAFAALARLTGADPGGADARHDTARSAFAARFARADGTLLDVVDPLDGEPGTQLRPNQLLAWSLPYAPLRPEPAVLDRIAGALLTPLGPRSLDPADPAYRGLHRGSSADRDHAYHQGTVWPWLMGPYTVSARRAGVSDPALFDGIVAHLAEHGLGSISETADGDAPHRGTGCPFQAWSVATVRNAW
jgi:predicted glycogen debranching enzyme